MVIEDICDRHGKMCKTFPCNREQEYTTIHYSNYEIPVGAFEVLFMGIRLHSKLESKMFPKINKLAETCRRAY